MNHVALHPDRTKFMLVVTRQKRQNLISSLSSRAIDADIVEEVQNHSLRSDN